MGRTVLAVGERREVSEATAQRTAIIGNKLPLALDLTGLFLAPFSHSPRGIDRVELAYARHFLNHWPGECWAILPPPWGTRCFERERAKTFLSAVEDLWQERIHPQADATYRRVKKELRQDAASERPSFKPSGLSPIRIVRGYFRILTRTGFTFGRSAAATLPANAIYLNVGQLQLFRPWFWWLNRRRDVNSVFMIHDVTPIEHPSHHPPLIVRLHHRLMRNTAEFGRSLIFPSETSRASTLAELKKYQPAAPPSRVELLPVPDEFLGDISPDPDLAGANYFVVCGALDPHKNHAFLLHVWKKVIDSLGARSPKLVIAGSIQLSSGTVLRMLEQDAGLRRHVVLAPGLATPSLRSLILSAKALIMPSISEGFGLPIVEALAQGTAVIASDIPAHREAGRGGDVTYLSLGEAGIWAETIRDFSADGRRSNGDYRPKTWTDYFVGIEAFLNQLPALASAPAEEDIALATKATS